MSKSPAQFNCITSGTNLSHHNSLSSKIFRQRHLFTFAAVTIIAAKNY